MRLLLLTILLLSQTVLSQQKYVYFPPNAMNDGLETADLRTITQDTVRLYSLFNQLPGGDHELHSLLVLKDGKLVLEEYLNGFDANTRQDQRSASKSVRSLLVGIAIDQGFIESIDDPLQKYLGDLKPQKNPDPRKDQITIRDLLSMSPGWDCNDRDKSSAGQEDRIYRKKDWLQYALDLPMINDPGSVTNYCSIGTVMLMEVVERASKMPLEEFAAKYLFEPLGISNYNWGHTSKKEVSTVAKRLYMTPRDMAKIGLLVLQNGQWNGQQLIPEDWIALSTSEHTKIDGSGYGFLWWMTAFPGKNQKAIPGFAASGNGGQYIVIFPSENLICVFTGGAYNSDKAGIPLLIMRDVLIPTFANSRK